MEKILNLILTKVEGLEKGQAKLEEGFNSFGNRLDGIHNLEINRLKERSV